MSETSKTDPLERDLGVTLDAGPTVRGHAIVPRDVITTTRDLQRHAASLVDNVSGPEGVVDKVLDHFFPDPVRREQRKGEHSMARTEITTRVRIHEIVKEAQVKQVEKLASAFGIACELEAEEEIGRRAIETATVLDGEIARSGAEFDRRLDVEITQGVAELKSDVAKQALGHRLKRRIALRGEIEDAVLHSVRDAVQGAGRKT